MAFTAAQLAAIHARNPELLVSAAAGSGKTSVLIERIVSLIERDGLSVDRMLIVTFTRAAACEMRDRLATRLNEAGMTNRRMRIEAEKLEAAQIGTIHGFCTKLVREYFQLVEIDPQAAIADDILGANLLNESLDETLTTIYEQALTDADLRSLTQKFEEKQIATMLLELHRFMSSLPEPAEWLHAQTTHDFTLDDLKRHPMADALLGDCRMILCGAAELCDDLRALLPTAHPKDQEVMQLDIGYFERLIAAANDNLAALLQAHQDKPFARMPVFRKAEEAQLETHALYKEARARLDDLNKQIGKRLPPSAEGCIADLQAMQPALRGLAAAATLLEECFAAHKAEKSVIDFNDLEHMSLRILKVEGAREQLVQRYDAIFVDEYQDVSAIQEAILNGLRRDVSRETLTASDKQNDSMGVSRETLTIEDDQNGGKGVSRETLTENANPASETRLSSEASTRFDSNLSASQDNCPKYYFYVGDVKQSIYRFRQADPTLFQEKLRTFSADEDAPRRKISLNRNFRSRENVLAATNRVFRRVMRADVTQIDYDADAMLYPGRETKRDLQTTVHVYADATATAADKPAIEALEIARMIRQRVGQPKIEADGTVNGTIRYRDCAVLMPVSKGVSDVVERVLEEQGIPVYSEDHRSGLESDEIRQALGHLRLLANERDDLSLLSELRGPIYEWTDAELAGVRLLKPDGDYLSALRFAADQRTPLGDRARAAIDGLSRERFLLRAMPLDEYLWDWLARSGLFGYYGCQSGGRLRQANLRMLCHKASEHSQRGGDLTDFIQSVTALAEVADKTSPTVLSPWEDVVRLMTIHKSKGLEFPITFVMGLGNAITRRAATGDATMHPALGVALRYVNERARVKRDTLLKSAIDLRVSAEERAERARVLYVAMTRARDELILLGSVSAKSGWSPNRPAREQPNSYAVWQAKCLMDWVCDAITTNDDIYCMNDDACWERLNDGAILDNASQAASCEATEAAYTSDDALPNEDRLSHGEAADVAHTVGDALSESKPSDEIHNVARITDDSAKLSMMSTSFPQKNSVWRVFFHNDIRAEENVNEARQHRRTARITDEERRAARLAALYRETNATGTDNDEATQPEHRDSSNEASATQALISEAQPKHCAAANNDGVTQASGYASAFNAPFGTESAFDDPIAPRLRFTHEPFKLGVTALCRAEREGAAEAPTTPRDGEDDASDGATEETVETKRLPFPQARPRTLADLPRYPSFMRAPEEEGGVKRGSATHKALSLIDYGAMRADSTLSGINAELDRLAAARLLSAEERSLVNAEALRRFFASELGRDALNAKETRREWSFNLRIPELGGTIVQGVIDLCWLRDGAWRLVDYKTDRVATVGELWTTYGRQLDYYRRALTDATSYPVADATLFSLSLGEYETRGGDGSACLIL